jgi:hypothetical protein
MAGNHARWQADKGRKVGMQEGDRKAGMTAGRKAGRQTEKRKVIKLPEKV